MQKIFFLLTLFFFSSTTLADEVKNLSELALLPHYCGGTQQVRSISKDPTPIADYVATYGKTYTHLHHYCWALNTENNAWKTRDNFLRKSKLGYALGDIKYVLDRAEPGFVFLPDIYHSQARILFSLKRDSEAILALNKAIEAKPDFVSAITQLSDYYAKHNDKKQAISVLVKGIDHTQNAEPLIRRLNKLGGTYQGTPGNARKEAIPVELSTPPPAGTENSEGAENGIPASAPSQAPEETPPALQNESAPANNPYCRFCP